MPELNDLWDWLAYVRETNAFLIALPSFVGFILACTADWLENYFSGYGERVSSQKETLMLSRGAAGGQRPVPRIDLSSRPS